MKTQTMPPDSALSLDQSLVARRRRSFRAGARIIAQNRVKATALFTAASMYIGNAFLKAGAACSTNTFLCDATEYTAKNEIIAGAGSGAQSLINFPFAMLVIFAIYLVVVCALSFMGEMASGREWQKSFIVLGAVILVMFLVTAILQWMTGSFATGAATGGV